MLTANIEITNLTKDYPAESRPNNAVTWAVWFTHGPDALIHYVKAVSNGTAITYKYGGYTVEDTAVLGEMGDTTGSFFEGPDGIVSIVVPAALVAPGESLTKVSARISFKKTDADNSYTADRAPDAAADDPGYTQVDCPAVEETPTPTPTATPTPTPDGGSRPRARLRRARHLRRPRRIRRPRRPRKPRRPRAARRRRARPRASARGPRRSSAASASARGSASSRPSAGPLAARIRPGAASRNAGSAYAVRRG